MTMAASDCEPCTLRKVKKPAYRWCCDCEESLCDSCTECHISMKATKNHDLIELNKAKPFLDNPLSPINLCKQHGDTQVEYFCKDHQTLCCCQCLTSVFHRTCKIESITALCSDVKTSKVFKEVKLEIRHILELLSKIESEQEESNKIACRDSDIVKQSIGDLKSKVIQQLDVLEASMLQEIKEKQKISEKEHTKLAEEAKSQKEIVQVYKSMVEFVETHGSVKQTFVLTHNLRKTLQSLREQIIGQIARMKTVSFQHKIPKDFLKNLNLGSIELKEESCTDKFKLHAEDYKVYQHFRLNKRIDMTKSDSQAFITGMCIFGDKLFLCNCDWNHNIPHLLVYNKNGEYVKNIEVDGAPWDIAVIPGTSKAVVTLPNKNCIQFIDAAKLSSGQVVKLAGSDEKRGIAATTDKIFVGGLDRYIYVLDLEGKLMSTIFENREKFSYLQTVQDTDLIYSDSTSIHRIRLDGSEVYSFRSPKLRNPKKFAIDQLGNLYIAGKDSSTIHRLTPEGKFLDIVLSEKDDINHPRAIVFDPEHNNLFLSNNGGSELLMFHCS